VPQTRQQISAVSRPKFTILSGHVEEVLLFNNFFRLSIHASLPKIYSPTNLCDGAKMAIFLGPVFPASRVQHISDLHSKFALGPHGTPCVEVWWTSNLRPLRLGEKKEEE